MFMEFSHLHFGSHFAAFQVRRSMIDRPIGYQVEHGMPVKALYQSRVVLEE